MAATRGPCPKPTLSHPERIVEHGLVQNAIYRLARVTPAWTRCLILLLRYTAISDDKRTGIIKFGLNLANGSALDPFVDDVFTAALSVRAPLARVCRRTRHCRQTGPPPLAHHGHTRSARLGCRRICVSFSRVCNGAWSAPGARACLLHGPASGSVAAAAQTAYDAARERLRLEAAAREYQAKVADLRQKYDLRVTIELEQTLILTSPVQRLELTIKRRKANVGVALDWHPSRRPRSAAV